MELKTNYKKNAITLVELIIALTMVSVLMVMMFSVIFKKTKASILSPSGTFYCWKDWDGKLHQMTISTKGAITKKEPDKIVSSDYCTLNFPGVVTKEVNNIKAYIIGGGASGDVYYNLQMKIDTFKGLNDQIKTDTKCFSEDSESKCLFFDSEGNDGYITCNNDQRCDLSVNTNYIMADRVLGKCVIDLLDKDGKPQKYAIDTSSEILTRQGLHYNRGHKDSSLPCNDEGLVRYKADFYPYLSYFDGESVQIIQPGQLSEVSDDKVEYKIPTKISYEKMHSSTKNEFISVDMTNKFDLNKPLKININDIGNPGIYKLSSTLYTGSGGNTVLRSNIDNSEVATAKGAEFKRGGRDYYIPKNDLSNLHVKEILQKKSNLPLTFSTCCEGNNQKCNLERIDTKIGDFIGLNNPEIPNVNYNCNSKKTLPTKVEYKENKSGFGLFGYNGAPNDCVYDYYPYKSLKAYDFEYNQPKELVNSPNNCSETGPGNGMGGAIIIKWN